MSGKGVWECLEVSLPFHMEGIQVAGYKKNWVRVK